MDATVNDFFNEINQIAPKKEVKEPENVWQECFDETSGYSYYWNTVTDQVTWTQPKLFIAGKKGTKQPKLIEKKKSELFVPPSAPLFPSASVPTDTKLKIYSIQENVQKTVKKNVTSFSSEQKPLKKRPSGKSSGSDDEKIELITSYGDETESEPEDNTLPIEQELNIKQNDSMSEEDDDIDLLAKIQKRAKELQKLGGDVPPEVKNIIKKTPFKDKPTLTGMPNDLSGFSLVAGYNSASSDSEEEDGQVEIKPEFPVVPIVPTVETGHSTLFPITQPIDVKDFIAPSLISPQEVIKKVENGSGDFDSKAFKRKRRIGISLVNTAKKPKEDGDIEYKGFGFKSEQEQSGSNVSENEIKESFYSGFQKGGVMFVKSDVLNLTTSSKDERVSNNEPALSKSETEDSYNVLREKLMFLGEGRDPVLPVQVMVIQAETLFLAMKEDGLKLSYLHKWLKETCSELIKLEKEAAPEGWLLQWDRFHKRYFYLNQATGQSQWGYPEPDSTRCDDAMDISTTPPPPAEPEPPVNPPLPPSPPLPPIIRSPTPPPPPMISGEEGRVNSSVTDVPLPPEPILASKKLLDNGEPLPPGVDMPEIVSTYIMPMESEVKPDFLSSALNSFYSEIAAASENTNSNSPTATPVPTEIRDLEVEGQGQINQGESVKKKKKKVKLTQGLTMKKKGVSQLVEKWKNVQKNLGD